MGGSVVKATSRPLYSREWAGTHWVGPRAGLKGANNIAPTEFDPQSVQPVSKPGLIPMTIQRIVNAYMDTEVKFQAFQPWRVLLLYGLHTCTTIMPTNGPSTQYTSIFSDIRRQDSLLTSENIHYVDGLSVVFTAILKHNGDEWP